MNCKRLWWLPTLVLVCAVPEVWANRLKSLVYDVSQNQVHFSLSSDVEPRGALLSNPPRIVIDLPNTEFRGETFSRTLGRGVQALRVGQVDATTTRLVIELSQNAVAIDAQDLRLRTAQPGEWVLYLPRAIAAANAQIAAPLLWPAQGELSSPFGWRIHPIDGVRRMHRGIDIAAAPGSPIFAAEEGVVTEAGWDDSGFGNRVEVRHPSGKVTLYAHASRVLVEKGQSVTRGQAIAEVGSTGRSTGPHLHFEVHLPQEGRVDPLPFLPMPVLRFDLGAS
jgi:murein DD-endopeptidase MepM/ murein hydrolase activator NlpD